MEKELEGKQRGAINLLKQKACREGDNAPEGTERGDVDFNAPEGGLIYT